MRAAWLTVILMTTLLVLSGVALADFSAYSSQKDIKSCQCETQITDITIKNDGPEKDTYFLSLEGNGLSQLSNNIVPLQPGETQEIILYTTVPCDEIHSSLTVNIDSFKTGKRKKLDFNIESELCNNIQLLTTKNLTDKICVNETYKHPFTLKNVGTFRDNFLLSVKGEIANRLALPREIALQPNESMDFQVFLDANTSYVGNNQFEMIVRGSKSKIKTSVPFSINISKCLGAVPNISTQNLYFVESVPTKRDIDVTNVGDATGDFNIVLLTNYSWLNLTDNVFYNMTPGETRSVSLLFNPEAINGTNQSLLGQYNLSLYATNNDYLFTLPLEISEESDMGFLWYILLAVLLLLLIVLVFLAYLYFSKGRKPKTKEKALSDFEEKPKVRFTELLRKRFYHYPLFWILFVLAIILVLLLLYLAGFNLWGYLSQLWANILALKSILIFVLLYWFYILMGLILLFLIIVAIYLLRKPDTIQKVRSWFTPEPTKPRIQVKHIKEDIEEETTEAVPAKTTKKEPAFDFEPTKEKFRQIGRFFSRNLWWILVLLLILFLGAVIYSLFAFGVLSLAGIGSFFRNVFIWLAAYIWYIVLGIILILLALLLFRLYDRYYTKKTKAKKKTSKKRPSKKKTYKWWLVLLLLLLFIVILFFAINSYLQKPIPVINATNITEKPENVSADLPANITETKFRIITNESTIDSINLYDYFFDPDEEELEFYHSPVKDIYIDITDDGRAYILPNYSWTGTRQVYFTANDTKGGIIDSQLIEIVVLPEEQVPESNYYLVWDMNTAMQINFYDYFYDPDEDELDFSI